MDQSRSYNLCPGRIVINSRAEREVTFYTFGGSVESQVLAGETVYSVRSSAPVLELAPERETIADLLAAETEGLFARTEARSGLSSHALLEQLTAVQPEAVYLAVLQSLLPPEGSSAVHHQPASFVSMLRNEHDWYKKTGRWPAVPQSLDSLLSRVA